MKNVTEIQRWLISKGYLAPVDDKGRPNDDGVFGTISLAAYNRARAAKGLKPHEGVLLLTEINRVLFPEEQPPPPPPKSNPIADWLLSLATKQAVSKLKGLIPMNFLSGYKTYATAFVIAIMGIYSLFFGELPLVGMNVDPGSAIMALLSALGLGFARGGAKADVKKIE